MPKPYNKPFFVDGRTIIILVYLRKDGMGKEAIASEPGHGHDGQEGGGQQGDPPHAGVITNMIIT
jgi:hypothetical protein